MMRQIVNGKLYDTEKAQWNTRRQANGKNRQGEVEGVPAAVA